MRFRLGLATGLAAGYYLGARAGRQRYDQINRQLTKLKSSDAFDEAAERARSVVTEGVEKARSLVDRGSEGGVGATNGSTADAGPGLIVPGETAPPVAAEIVVPIAGDLTGLVDGTELADVTELGDPTDTGTDSGTGTGTGPEGGGYSSSR